MLYTLFGFAFLAAILHEPTRKRIDDAISVLFTGKTEAEKVRERDRRIIASELKISSALSGSDMSDEKAEQLAAEIVQMSEDRRRDQNKNISR